MTWENLRKDARSQPDNITQTHYIDLNSFTNELGRTLLSVDETFNLQMTVWCMCLSLLIEKSKQSEIPSLCRTLPHRKFSAGFYLRLSVQCLVCRISFCGCLNPQFWNALHTFSIQSQIAFQINFIANLLCNKMLHYVGLWVIACSCDKIAGCGKVEILVSEQALITVA